MNINLVMLGARLTRDPQTKNTPGGMVVCEFGVATSEKRTNKQTGEEKDIPCFVDCVAFGKTGEVIAQHFQKGKAIFIEGKLKFDSWDDKQTGAKRSKLSVIVDRFHFVGPKEGGNGQSFDRSTSQERPRQSSGGGSRPRSNLPLDPTSESQQFDDADIPFRATMPDRWV